METVNIRFFAYLKEQTGCGETALTLPTGSSLKTCLTTLEQIIPTVKGIIQQKGLRIAVNQVLVENDEVSLHDGDEIAFLPPFSGG